jgi:uncharacterized protein (TIGR03790 family)
MPTPKSPVIGPLASLALAAGLALPALAGGPENTLLIIDPSSPVSLYLGNYYKNAHNLPDSSVLYLDPGAANHADFAATNLPALLGFLQNVGIADHTDFIVVAPGGDFFFPRSGPIDDGCSDVNRIAVASAYSMAFITDEVLAGTKSTLANGFFSNQTAPLAFDSNTAYFGGKASGDPKARRYFIGAMLGYTGHNGNTVDELTAMIDRAVATDGTRPGGAFYFMNNAADKARNVRAATYPTVVTALQALGFAAETIDGILPVGRSNALGVMTGAANPNLDSGQWSFAPGSAPFADHLTSFAGTFDDDSQTKMSLWIAKGAVGSLGAVEEPCNYIGKFPNARLHLFYAQGATLAEAYYRSAAYVPFQMLFYGDPLARPFAFIPSVTVPDAPGGLVSGTISLSPQATTDRPNTFIAYFDLLLDGVKSGMAFPNQQFTIDTTQLAEGFHDLRVIAYDSSPLLTQGRWTGLLNVDNDPLSAKIVPDRSSGNLGTLFGFDISGAGATVKEVRLLHNGRTVASTAGDGHVDLFGQTLGAGRLTLQAEALFKSGRTARSAPITIDIAYTGGGPGPAPTAFSYTKPAPTLDAALLVELPSTFSDDPASASTTLLSGPSKASVILNDGSPYILIQPDQNASGLDAITFFTTTPAGPSNIATVTIDYGNAAPPCAPDLNGDSALDLFDFLAFTNLFNAQDPAADCTADGAFDLFDFLCFVNQFNEGC